jgi:hypothetical protein
VTEGRNFIPPFFSVRISTRVSSSRLPINTRDYYHPGIGAAGEFEMSDIDGVGDEIGDGQPDDLVAVNAEDIYAMILKRYEELKEGRVVAEDTLAELKAEGHADMPVTIEDQFKFLLRIFDELDMLYIANLMILAQFKTIELQESEQEALDEQTHQEPIYFGG